MAEKTPLHWDALTFEGCHGEWSEDRSTVTIRFPPEGGMVTLSGETGHVGGVDWAQARYFGFDYVNHQPWSILVSLHFWLESNGGSEPDMTVTMGTLPQLKTRLALPLAALDSQRIFLPRTPGRLKVGIRNNRIDVRRVNRIGISLPACFAPQRIGISSPFVSVEEPEYPLPEDKRVDEFGQYTRKDWPNKTYSKEQLVAFLRAEAARPEPALPTDWSRFGGWKCKHFEPTGFFRAEHDGARWWLVDPEGYAFYSVGLDCVLPGEPAWVHGIEKLFSWLPDPSAEYGEFVTKAKDTRGYWRFRGHMPEDAQFVNFGGINLKRAFGADWWEQWARMTRRRVIDWGFNTVGNWSERRFTQWACLPYVWPLDGFPTTNVAIYRDFPDVFSEEYSANAARYAAQLEPFVGDPYLIGYFLNNEPAWAFIRDLNIAEEVLAQEVSTASKEALIAFLAERYGGDIQALSRAWGLHLAAFTDLTRPLAKASRLSPESEADLTAFSKLMIDRYARVPSEACRRVDPHHMNLGLRWASVHNPILVTGYEHFDVFSINCYRMSPEEEINKVGKLTGKPVLVGEFHFGALDRGLVSTGLRGVSSQSERAVSWRYYVENGAANPFSVGLHYFILNDQACLGRLDGENYNIGIVDVCHRPYEEFVRGIRATNRAVYEVASRMATTNPPAPFEIGRVG